MALIKCGECGEEMSDNASACPKCGNPNDKARASRKVGVGLVVGILLFPLIASWLTLKRGYSAKVRVVAFSWAALSTIIYVSGQNEAGHTATQEVSSHASSHAAEPALDVTANDISQAYSDNTVSADQRYKGKRFKVTGTVTEISTDFMGDPYVTLRGGVNQFMEPQFSFDKSNIDALTQMKKGMRVTLVCTGRGDIAKVPMSKDCAINR